MLLWVLVIVCAALVPRLFWVGWTYDADLRVYWLAAQEMLAHRSPYAYTAETQGMVIKYAPWTMPVFLPLGWMSWAVAKAVWFALELGCVAVIVRWVVRAGVSWRVALGSALGLWWMWQSHFSAGQIFLPIGALVLWGAPPAAGPGRSMGMVVALSAKIYPLATALGAWRVILRPKFWAWLTGYLVLAHLVLAWVAQGELVEFYRAWMQAAASGGAELGAWTVRGPANHGLTALVLRVLHVDPRITWPDTLVALGLTMSLGSVWHRGSRALSTAERWAGWIALGVIVHPLAWQHSFVLVYPLCAFALQAALRVAPQAPGRRFWIAAAWVAIAMIGLVIPPLWGSALVEPLEVLGLKSWGVVLAAVVLVRARDV